MIKILLRLINQLKYYYNHIYINMQIFAQKKSKIEEIWYIFTIIHQEELLL